MTKSSDQEESGAVKLTKDRLARRKVRKKRSHKTRWWRAYFDFSGLNWKTLLVMAIVIAAGLIFLWLAAFAYPIWNYEPPQ